MHLSSRWKWLPACAPGVFAAAPAFGATAASPSKPPVEGMWLFLQYACEQGEKFGWVDIVVHVLIAAMISLLLLWTFAAKIVGRKKMLTKVALFVGSILVLTAAFLALGYFVLRSQSIMLLVALIVVYLAIIFGQTRYLLGASRSAASGLMALYLVLAAGSLYGTEFITGRMPWTEFVIKPLAEQRRLFAEWEVGHRQATASLASAANPSTLPAAASADAGLIAANTAGPTTAPEPAVDAAPEPTPAAPPRPPIPAPDLAALYEQLQKTRGELDTKDPAAVARFNEQAAAYHQEKAIATALAAPKAQPVKAQPTASTAPLKAHPTSAGTKPAKN